MNYARAVAIGAVSGLRSMTGPAVVAEAASRRILRLKGTPLAWLGSGTAARTSAVLALGELVADKLPFMPNRTDPPGLAARFLSGALCGIAVAGRRNRRERIISALVAGAAAVGAAYVGNQYRKRVKLPPLAAALIEDAVAVGSGAAVVSRLCR
jgi:uncharacterized membrane protein